jgi:hypothetical protein
VSINFGFFTVAFVETLFTHEAILLLSDYYLTLKKYDVKLTVPAANLSPDGGVASPFSLVPV